MNLKSKVDPHETLPRTSFATANLNTRDLPKLISPKPQRPSHSSINANTTQLKSYCDENIELSSLAFLNQPSFNRQTSLMTNASEEDLTSKSLHMNGIQSTRSGYDR